MMRAHRALILGEIAAEGALPALRPPPPRLAIIGRGRFRLGPPRGQAFPSRRPADRDVIVLASALPRLGRRQCRRILVVSLYLEPGRDISIWL
jgi:hypothetical protein